jgi:hypothetical protein
MWMKLCVLKIECAKKNHKHCIMNLQLELMLLDIIFSIWIEGRAFKTRNFVCCCSVITNYLWGILCGSRDIFFAFQLHEINGIYTCSQITLIENLKNCTDFFKQVTYDWAFGVWNDSTNSFCSHQESIINKTIINDLWEIHNLQYCTNRLFQMMQ